MLEGLEALQFLEEIMKMPIASGEMMPMPEVEVIVADAMPHWKWRVKKHFTNDVWKGTAYNAIHASLIAFPAYFNEVLELHQKAEGIVIDIDEISEAKHWVIDIEDYGRDTVRIEVWKLS